MIISHRYQFIFVKTGKVGGTSLEIALSRFLGPDDVITTISWKDELDRHRRGFRTAQNFDKTFGELRLSEYPRWLRSALLRRFRRGEEGLRGGLSRPDKYRGHMNAKEIKARIGDQVWDEYYKFSIERNPWDKMVSKYFWDPDQKKTDISFRDYIFAGGCASNYDYYSINGLPAMDRMVRYEELGSELADLSHAVGLPENVYDTMKTINAKSGYRKDSDYREMYDDELRDLVGIHFAREIRMMGYEF